MDDMSDATAWDDLLADFGFTDAQHAEIERRARQLCTGQRHGVVDRHTRIQAGHAVGKLLGYPEGRDQLDAIGRDNHDTIVVLLTTDGPEYVQRSLDGRPGPVTTAVYDPVGESVTFRSPEQALLDARLRAGIAEAEWGETVSLGDFSQRLDDEEA